MIRSLVSPLLHLGESVLDPTRSTAEVVECLARGSRGLRVSLGIIEARSPDWAAHARLTLNLLAELGYLDPMQPPESLDRDTVLPTHGAAEAWREGLAGRIPVSRAGIPMGTSAMLASLLELEGLSAGDFVLECIERMMRHVELRRTQAFPPIAGTSGDDLWLEKHQAAILLARASDILGDLRYLNAALKLNDFAYRAHRRFQPDLPHILYLRALAEQDLALSKVRA